MSKHRQATPSRRHQRVSQEIKQALARLLSKEMSNLDVLAESVTITGVDVSPDLRNATVYITPLGGNRAQAEDLAAELSNHQSFLRRELGRSVYLKHTPKLSFRADTSFEQAWSVESKLASDRVQHDLAQSDDSPHDDDTTEN